MNAELTEKYGKVHMPYVTAALKLKASSYTVKTRTTNTISTYKQPEHDTYIARDNALC